jgi:hypothetical protein
VRRQGGGAGRSINRAATLTPLQQLQRGGGGGKGRCRAAALTPLQQLWQQLCSPTSSMARQLATSSLCRAVLGSRAVHVQWRNSCARTQAMYILVCEGGHKRV